MKGRLTLANKKEIECEVKGEVPFEKPLKRSVDTKTIKKCWDRGRIHIRLLDDTGQYGKLASYLVKEKGRKKMEKYGGKTYSPI